MLRTSRALLSAGISRKGVHNVHWTTSFGFESNVYLATLAVVQAPCPVDDGVIGAIIQNDSAPYGAPSVFGAEVVEALEYWAVLTNVASCRLLREVFLYEITSRIR